MSTVAIVVLVAAGVLAGCALLVVGAVWCTPRLVRRQLLVERGRRLAELRLRRITTRAVMELLRQSRGGS